jgi:hypothetical protein
LYVPLSSKLISVVAAEPSQILEGNKGTMTKCHGLDKLWKWNVGVCVNIVMNDRALRAVKKLYIRLCAARDTKITNLEKPLREMQLHSLRPISDDVAAERERLQEEKESIIQGLAICAKASEHLRERLQEEKESTEQCLAICAKALGCIGQLQSNLSEFSRNISIPGVLISSERLTANALQECKDILTNVTVDLEEHSKLW